MSQRNKKRVDTSDSEPDEDMLQIIEEKHRAENDDIHDETDHGQIYDIKTKLALVNRIKEINKRRTISHKVAVKHIDWSQVEVDGLDADDAKECLNQILEPVNAMRTLDEMLNDYLENYQKYELKKALHAPKLPANPCMRYIQEHRAELEKKLIKKNPNEKIKLGDVSKYGAKRFHKLPEEEKQRYKDLYKQELEEYHKQRDELIRMNPELKKPRKKYDSNNTTKSSTTKKKPGSKPEKEETVVTPFKIFYQELKEKNPEVKFRDAQIQYMNLGDPEKLAYINKVLYLETDLDKVFTIDEKKIMKHSSGMPVRPLSAYNSFVQAKIKNSSLGKGKSSMKIISDMWKSASEEEKKYFEQKFNDDLEKWKQDMMSWVNTLPMDQRAEQIAKHKLFSKSKRKREDSESSEEPVVKLEESMRMIEPVIEIASVEEVRQKSPKKKKITSDSEASSSPSKKNKSSIDWDQAFDSKKTSSPKKESIEKQLEALGQYPSQTTAHYFMSKKCDGKSVKKVAKAYKDLSRTEKKKLFREMNQAKTAYLNKIKEFAKKIDPKYSTKVMEFHKQNKEQQEKSISWHKASGTDNEDDSSSSDDSDEEDSDES